MSGIAVIFRRDGAPVPQADLDAMTDAMRHPAVDAVHHEADGPMAVGFCSMVTTPVRHGERQPLRCRGGSTIIAFDGRLDDRRTLRARLGRRVPTDASDAQLLLLAIERWGAGFVNHILGDFAIVIADPVLRRVVCARDHLGVKPLYYASIGPTFIAASEVRAVLAHPAVPGDIDVDAFAAWSRDWIVPDGTVWSAVAQVPMASVLVATSHGIVGPWRHWDPSCEPDGPRPPSALIEEYRWLVAEATRDRLRSVGPVVVAMSGGLDSTSVASTALGLSRRDAGVPEVRVASLVYPGHPRADESELIGSMERRLDLSVRRVRPRPRTPEDLAEEIRLYQEPPAAPNDQVAALVRPELGERVVLTGLGGDDWFYNSMGLHITRAVRHGRWLTAVRAARRGKADGRYRHIGEALWRFGLRPLPKVPGAVVARSPVLVKLARSIGGELGARFIQASWCPAGVPLDSAWVLSASRNPRLSGRLAIIQRAAAGRGFEYRHPLHDVRLVELSLRMPGHLRNVDGDGRWLPRRAMADALPDDVRLRRAKAEFSLTVRAELRLAAGSGLLDRALAASDPSLHRARAWQEIRATDDDLWDPRQDGLWSALIAQIWRDT